MVSVLNRICQMVPIYIPGYLRYTWIITTDTGGTQYA